MIRKIACLVLLSLSLTAGAGLPTLKNGWPVTFSTNMNENSVINVGNLYGNDELIIFIGKPMASLYQFYNHKGEKVTEYSWGAHNWIQAAFYDFDGDKREEIVLGGHGCSASFQMNSTAVLKLNDDGWSKCEGWNQSTENSIGQGFAIADLDNDGEMEIIGACCAHGAINVWNFAGQKKAGFPTARNKDKMSYFTPMVQVGDITGDGNLEIVHRHYTRVRVLKADGNSLPGWPKNGALYGVPGGWQPVNKQCSLADINGDGKCEILYALTDYKSGMGNRVVAWQADGSNLSGWPCEIPFDPRYAQYYNDPPIAGDMDGDGKLEVAASRPHCSYGGGSYVCLIDSAGNLLWKKQPENLYSHLVMGDIDNDGVQEIVCCSNDQLFAWHKDGSSPTGFPMTIDLGSDDYWSSTFSPQGRIILEDIDNNGRIEMILTMVPYSITFSGGRFTVYDCDTENTPGAVQWGYKYFNRRNTSCYEKP